ncbi:MAG TPA: alpha/beta hydrolase [Verrucomicrobiales bacterium]|nr:alpha/beta hydrolase [Verrucomicrobiales bacterium]
MLQSLAAASLPAISIKSAGANVLNGRLPRMDLLRYRDRRGEVRRVESKSDWAKRRNEILRGMQEIMGPLPDHKKRLPVAMEIIDEVDGGTYVRRLISYGSEAESRTPAHLLIPKSALEKNVRAPAVLCLHPTDDKIGHDVVVGLGGKPNRAYAAELAERGFVALAPSYPLLAGYQPDLGGLGYHSGTMKAIWDNIRGLDLLESLHFVKRGGFGTIGHSLGGHNSVFTAVFDERLKVVVTSCGLDSFVDYYGGSPDVWKPERGWCQLRYMPRLLEYAGRLEEIPFDFPELIGALAPRVCFISAPTGDGNFKWESVDRIGRAARPVYELFGKSDNLIIEHPDCGHDFPDGIRSRAYSLLEKHLN